MRIPQIQLVWFVVAMAVCIGTGCDESDSRLLKDAVEGIWADTAIGADQDYQTIAKRDAQAEGIAPADMREVAKLLSGRRTLRHWPKELTFRCSDQRICLSWTGGITSKLESTDALAQFDDAMRDRGYEVVVEHDVVDDLSKRAGFPAHESWAVSKNHHCYRRQVGRSEIVAFAESVDYTGGRGGIVSGVTFQWHVLRDYPHPQPTLGETLAALPSWCRVSWLKASFYESLSEETISRCSAGNGTSIEFEHDVVGKLVSALEAGGEFEYRREQEPLRGIQKTWYRHTDATFAHIITWSDSDRVRFKCQAPQHKGPPRTEKPPPQHPSLRLPRSKRPIVALETLAFADPRLKQQARFFHDLADGVAQDDWSVQGYRDLRDSFAPHYVASWESQKVQQTWLPKSERPHRSMTVTLDGPAPGDGNERINALQVRGTWTPRQGWAAMVNYSTESNCWAFVGLVQPQDEQYSLLNSTNRMIRLTRHNVSVSLTDGSFGYEYSIQLPYDQSRPGAARRRERFMRLFESPEAMRDEVLDDFAALRRIATDRIAEPGSVSVTDHTNVRTDRPPVRLPPSEGDVPETMQKRLLDEVRKKLDSHEELIRQRYEAVHSALTTALPLDGSEFD